MLLQPSAQPNHPDHVIQKDGRTIDFWATVRFTYGVPGLLDGEVYDVAHPEGFSEDKSGPYWPNGEFEKPALRYAEQVEILSHDLRLNVLVGEFTFYSQCRNAKVKARVELHPDDEEGAVWWITEASNS